MQVSTTRPQSVFNTQCQALTDFLETKKKWSQKLYQHQVDAVLAARKQLQDSDQPDIALVVLPTGCGKTGVAVLAAYALNATRVLVITPSEMISKQIHEAFCGNQGTNKLCFLAERRVITQGEQRQVCPPGAWIRKASEISQHRNDNFMVVNAHKIGGKSSVKIEDIPNDDYDLVIVDEAHHYPAPTWKLLVDHFRFSSRLFLTATPEFQGSPILDHDPCFRIDRPTAVDRGIIRGVEFYEVPEEQEDTATVMKAVAKEVRKRLDHHDRQYPKVRHQAMVLTQTISTLNPADDFSAAYDAVLKEARAVGEEVALDEACEKYVSDSPREVVNNFEQGKTRTLVIVGRLLEGYDNKRVSVVGIVRNVAKESKVLFAQFVGRAVRKSCPDDPVKAVIVTHKKYKQKVNYDQFDKVAEEDYFYDHD